MGSAGRMKIDDMSASSMFGMFLLFLLLFGGFVALGFFVGPDEFNLQEEVTDSASALDGPNNAYTVYFNNTDKLSQSFTLLCKPTNPNDFHGYNKYINFTVSMAVRNYEEPWKEVVSKRKHERFVECPDHETDCTQVALVKETFIDYTYYKFDVYFDDKPDFIGNVKFTVQAYNRDFTLFEIVVRYSFLVIGLFFVFQFWIEVRRGLKRSTTQKSMIPEQRLTMWMLFSLIFLNNPMIGLDLLMKGYLMPMITTLVTAFFITNIFTIWLMMGDLILRSLPHEFDEKTSQIGKFIWGTLFFGCTSVFYAWFSMLERDDPTLTFFDFEYFIYFSATAGALLVIWLFWFVHTMLRSWEVLSESQYTSSRFKFFFTLTSFVILFSIGGLIFGFIGPRFHNSSSFMFFISLYNVYAYIIAVVHMPGSSGKDTEAGDGVGMIRMEDDQISNDSFNF